MTDSPFSESKGHSTGSFLLVISVWEKWWRQRHGGVQISACEWRHKNPIKVMCKKKYIT